jgi:hypothetical protein
MPKSQDKPKQVLIIVKPGKRGYIVEAAGSGQPYPCLDAEGIGEAVIEILEDPEQDSVEFEAAEPAPSKQPRRQAAAEEEPEEPEEEPEVHHRDDDGGPKPEGWTAGDELLIGLIGSGVDRLRRASKWRK